MTRGGGPNDPYYSDDEPTQYGPASYSDSSTQRANYGGHDRYPPRRDYGQEPPVEPPPTPWYRKPAGLLALGALGAIVIALATYAVVSLADGGSSTPTSTPTTASATTTSASVAPVPTQGTKTITETESPSTTTVTTDTSTTTSPPSTSTSTSTSTVTSTSVSTSTETVTVRPTLFPRPGGA